MREGLGKWQGASDSCMKLLVGQWEHMAAKFKSYPTGEDVMDVYASTLVAGVRFAESDGIHCVTASGAYEA
ncbi:predicted protein [Sclerotinia sclerotiorum 1980 UF-70]|uniref:Uncharacterized protein n=2 Tax=Sclerotinia sclerotiorum (strain ATCC 18683 / 1980 / Ss-1) TaxID=665079 RepID=A7E8W2_SCLS1|nr:predicted protein [Sclerotinia sclerotiorum 1980 UF-70]APA05875.1 hypothetical protein sscle_01g006450 [Sclerotinia sclerotiorum 1980 UF-70]EDN96814.1 predicted protein [Sclerotinia sclerotiorum 1980 UF-70]